jgi:hypothetical protein
LDDLDKELNTYTMRVREWYGWHFPELRYAHDAEGRLATLPPPPSWATPMVPARPRRLLTALMVPCSKLIADNQAYVRTILTVGNRVNFATTDLSTILPEEVEEDVKEAAEISMGTEVPSPAPRLWHPCQHARKPQRTRDFATAPWMARRRMGNHSRTDTNGKTHPAPMSSHVHTINLAHLQSYQPSHSTR